MSKGNVPESFFCGGFGGICSVIIAYPIDTVKVRLQTMPIPKPGKPLLYSGIWDCIQKSTKNEGILFFYKGMTTPLICISPMTAVCFMGFEIGRKIFGPSEDRPSNDFHIFLSGVFAGFCTTPVATPGDRIKTLLQVQNNYLGPLDCGLQLYRKGGLPNIYRGLGATTLRNVPSTEVYFLTYNTIRRQFLDKQDAGVNIFATMLAGGVAGAIGYIIVMPIDAMKSKIQASLEDQHKNGVRQVFKEVMRTEGVTGFFRGGPLILLRAFVACSLCFLGVDLCHNSLKSYKTRQKKL